MIHEGERFLDAVEAAVRAHLDDPRAAVGAALELFLAHRRRGPADPHPAQRRRHRRHAALRHHPGHAGRRSGPPRGSATTIERGLAAGRRRPTSQLLAESLVRLAISYVTGPSGSPETTAASVADLLGPFIDRALGSA